MKRALKRDQGAKSQDSRATWGRFSAALSRYKGSSSTGEGGKEERATRALSAAGAIEKTNAQKDRL